MRKINPNDVRDAFLKEVAELIAYFDRVSGALQGTSRELGDISELAETVFLTACVAFERFLSDLFLAYMNRDFSAYQRDLRSRIEESVEQKFRIWAKARIAFQPAKHVPVSELETIVDASGRNIGFVDAADLKAKAQRWLAVPHRKRVHSINPDDERLFDTIKAIRNFLVHRSRGSKDTMDSCLAAIEDGGPNAGLGRGSKKVNNVGAYLKAYQDGDRRVLRYLERLKELAATI